MFLKEDAHEFLKQERLEELIQRYSEFITFPIYLYKKTQEVVEKDTEEEAEEADTSSEEKDKEEGDNDLEVAEEEEEKGERSDVNLLDLDWSCCYV